MYHQKLHEKNQAKSHAKPLKRNWGRWRATAAPSKNSFECNLRFLQYFDHCGQHVDSFFLLEWWWRYSEDAARKSVEQEVADTISSETRFRLTTKLPAGACTATFEDCLKRSVGNTPCSAYGICTMRANIPAKITRVLRFEYTKTASDRKEKTIKK